MLPTTINTIYFWLQNTLINIRLFKNNQGLDEFTFKKQVLSFTIVLQLQLHCHEYSSLKHAEVICWP